LTHYDVLGVSPTASTEEIRAQYRAEARRRHPDLPGGSAAAMAEVNAAWRVLSDPRRRSAYDRSLIDAQRGGAGDVHSGRTPATDDPPATDDSRATDDGIPIRPLAAARVPWRLFAILITLAVTVILVGEGDDQAGRSSTGR